MRQMQRNPSLDNVGAVVLDEFHERSLEADLALALVRDIQQLGREDLRWTLGIVPHAPYWSSPGGRLAGAGNGGMTAVLPWPGC